ncbi:glutaredoxin 3 [Reinekea blandensis]|uniref:Glutaredoxin n=1 Tax=Reinekea blandensis MED297 TaxID=314283 RepID=A4BE90_9GAMM|nr:glutaredoxin 3 [Reinekea blandensis]EAR09568.1 Glutaredoxin [Reinekea blandensis MED297]
MSADIRMYSSQWCPFCIQAKRLLESKQVSFKEIIVDGDPTLRAQMMQESGRHTVPQIWINGEHIGGCDELYTLERNQKLDSLLTEA